MRFQQIVGLFLALMVTQVALAQETSDYDKLVEKSMSDFGGKAEKLNKDYKLASYDRWDYEQAKGRLIFSNGGVTKVLATAQIVGSYSTYSGTWKWSWANETVDLAVKKDVGKVKEYGEKNKFKELINGMMKCDQEYAWTLTAIAGQILKVKGMYRGPISEGYVYFLITDINRVEK